MIVYLILGVFIGIVLGSLFERVISPRIDIIQEVYTYKKTNDATYYDLFSRKQIAEFFREYPEAKEQEENDAIDVIGFQHPDSSELYEDNCKNKKIGFIK